MSRNWERMVERNRKKTNKQRVKHGQSPIGEAGKEPMQAFKGRSWFLPIILVGFSVFFVTLPSSTYGRGGTFWFTLISYLVLAVFIYFVRRPFLRVGKTKLTTRRFSGDRTVEAPEIEEITLQKSFIIIRMKPRKGRWVFSKLMHQYDMPAMASATKEFAVRNGIPVHDDITGTDK